MKTELKSTIRVVVHSIGGAVCTGAILLVAAKAQSQNLFEADYLSDNIYEFTPGGVQSTFASGLDGPRALAFNNAGDLFVANGSSGDITEITPGGVQSTFASELDRPIGLAFQGVALPVPEPSALGLLAFGASALFIRRRKFGK